MGRLLARPFCPVALSLLLWVGVVCPGARMARKAPRATVFARFDYAVKYFVPSRCSLRIPLHSLCRFPMACHVTVRSGPGGLGGTGRKFGGRGGVLLCNARQGPPERDSGQFTHHPHAW